MANVVQNMEYLEHSYIASQSIKRYSPFGKLIVAIPTLWNSILAYTPKSSRTYKITYTKMFIVALVTIAK